MPTEKEKMLCGELYNANYDLELIAERHACKVLCQQYNTLPYENETERRALLGCIIGNSSGDYII